MSGRKSHFFGKRNKGSNSSQNRHRKPVIKVLPQKKEYRHPDQLTEEDVGITEYLNQLEGFSGVIKARFSDFQVNEIDLEGNIAKLTDTSFPKDFQPKLVKYNYKETEKSPLECIPQDKWEAIKALVETGSGEPVYIDVDNLDKEARLQVHTTVKDYFGKKIIASTKQKDDKKVIEIKKFDKEDKRDDRTHWPEDKGEYVYFLMYKESADTMEALMKISDAIKMSTGNFTYAGVKDRRAKTTQWCCVKKVEPWKLLVKTNHIRNVKIGNITFRNEVLMLGQLKGNKFRIALRNVLADDELINKSLGEVQKKGFVNYFGLQRFGNDKEVPTFKVGISLLLGKWKEAVQLILKPKNGDDPTQDLSNAKKIYLETGDAKKALAAIKHRNKTVEAKLISGLSQGHSNDFVNALEKIPRSMRLMYLHSFQSLIWNVMVSKRLKLFGTKPVVGDLVIVENNSIDNERQPIPTSENVLQEKGKEETLEDCDTDKDDIDNAVELENDVCKVAVKALTEDELENYTIYDIVLPLPGYDIIYPENMKEYYKEEIEKYGLSLEMPTQKVKTYTLSGNYRSIISKPEDLSWKTMLYNDPTDNLIRSDFEEMKGNQEPQSIEGGQYKALILEFMLPASCYATMVLREILKINTSSSAQAKLNNYHENKVGQKKILMDSEEIAEEKMEAEPDVSQSSSLLSDPEKYAAFKNSIFEDILGPTKRKNENEDDASKKSKTDNGVV